MNGARYGDVGLKDGRSISYAEWGNHAGAPVLFFHGNPGDRMFPFFDEWGHQLGLRFVCPDRPGFGASAFRQRRRITDWPGDVAEVADGLGIERFAVAGVSAGGPYVLACARALPERVTRAVFISGIAPPGAPLGSAGMRREARISVAVARRAWPVLVMLAKPMIGAVQRNPERFFDRSLRSMPEADRIVATRPEVRAWFLERARATGGRGSKGSAYELSIEVKPWGFELEEIAVPVAIWQGADDTLVPLHAAEWVANRVPAAQLNVVEGAGHLLLFDRWRDIFGPLATEVEE
ncbi:MAG: alpha/beta hydrolase [Acidobacteria bacterium]|nr:alpha/beta hydrolase [Acidobacteriota bacterium]